MKVLVLVSIADQALSVSSPNEHSTWSTSHMCYDSKLFTTLYRLEMWCWEMDEHSLQLEEVK